MHLSSRIKGYGCLKKVTHQINKNEWLLLSATFTEKVELVFVLTQKNILLRGFILNPIERSQILVKNGSRDFQNSPPFERSGCFYMTITGNFERLQYFNSKTSFLKNENLFRKTGVKFFS